jgi:hypothetical protein
MAQTSDLPLIHEQIRFIKTQTKSGWSSEKQGTSRAQIQFRSDWIYRSPSLDSPTRQTAGLNRVNTLVYLSSLSNSTRSNWDSFISSLRSHSPAMTEIKVATFRQLLKHSCSLWCWCPGCKRDAHCDIARLVLHGLAERQIDQCRPRCRKCGDLGEWQVRPPLPKFDGYARH